MERGHLRHYRPQVSLWTREWRWDLRARYCRDILLYRFASLPECCRRAMTWHNLLTKKAKSGRLIEISILERTHGLSVDMRILHGITIMNTELNSFLGPVKSLSLSGCQHGLGDELHLTNKLLIFLLVRSVRGNKLIFLAFYSLGRHWLCVIKNILQKNNLKIFF